MAKLILDLETPITATCDHCHTDDLQVEDITVRCPNDPTDVTDWRACAQCAEWLGVPWLSGPTTDPNDCARYTFSPNPRPEYWRGAIARIEWLIEDWADDAPEPATPNEPDPSQFWAGWNNICRLHPREAELPGMLLGARDCAARAVASA